jgi:hypothetical protein
MQEQTSPVLLNLFFLLVDLLAPICVFTFILAFLTWF